MAKQSTLKSGDTPPRQAQSPLVAAFRNECERRGLPTLTAVEEKRAGLGDREARPDLDGRRALAAAASWRAGPRQGRFVACGLSPERK